MHYRPRPSFKTKHWQQLYESRISDIKALKESAKGVSFVIVDAEPWGKDNSEPAEIGLFLLPPICVNLDCESMDTLPKTLDAASSSMGLETHWIRLIDRERRERGREQQRYGTQHCVSSDKVAETITSIIESFRDKTSGDAPLTLTGFAVVFELQVLSNIYPDLLNYFTSWVDLQEVASGMTDGIERPSLRETLIACGFEGYRHSQESRIARQHNAATDTVRTAMLLVRFLRLPSNEMLDIDQSSQKKQQFPRERSNTPATPKEKNYWKGSRPRPKEFYPFITKVYRTPTFEGFDGRNLFNLFSKYEPTAVGISNGKRYGWLCLPNLKTLENFVRSVHMREDEDGSVWEVFSEYDPTVIPAQDWEELKLYQKEELQAEIDEKRKQRRLKKESQSDEIWPVSF